ncbi:MAG TPA: cytochrome P450 [Dictyobacter sp.]|jgi:cytochrome P450|nr:cytochrome P450 [Dictyobacter sp.]
MSLNPHSLHDQLLYPHECFTLLRESAQHPVIYNEQAKFWEAFGYDDVRRIVFEHEIFSSEARKFSEHPDDGEFESILSLDPPRHRQLRSIVTQAFTPRTIAQLAPRIAEIAYELLENVVYQGHMDVIQDLSYPLPVTVIAELLGVPAADRDKFKVWSDNLVTGEYEDFIGEDQEERMKRARERFRTTTEEIFDYFRVVIVQRREQPCNDLISSLIAAQVDGEFLTESELLNFCTLLLVAGNITTTNLIGNAILCFDEHPEVMEQLRQDPALMPQAVEEVLRYRSPVSVIGRIAAQDLQLHDQEIKRGQFILGWVASANHDPAQFPHPEQFDIRRNPNRHVSFGHGIHFCLGAPLARLEAKIVLNCMLERLQTVRRDRDQEIVPVQSTFIYGAKRLPISFTRA